MNENEKNEQANSLPPIKIKKEELPASQSEEAIKKKAKITFIITGISGFILVGLLITAITIGAIELNRPSQSETISHYDDGNAGVYQNNHRLENADGSAIFPFHLTFSNNDNAYYISEIDFLPEEANQMVMPGFEVEENGQTLSRVIGTEDQESSLLSESYIETLYFPYPILSLGENSFAASPSLKEVYFSNGNLSSSPRFQIKDSAFENCSNLTTIDLPDSLSTLGDAVFAGCTLLTSLTLPQNLISIGANAFANSGLEELNYEGNSTSWELIEKDNAWNANSNIQRVVCKDKTIEIE